MSFTCSYFSNQLNKDLNYRETCSKLICYYTTSQKKKKKKWISNIFEIITVELSSMINEQNNRHVSHSDGYQKITENIVIIIMSVNLWDISCKWHDQIIFKSFFVYSLFIVKLPIVLHKWGIPAYVYILWMPQNSLFS